MYCINVLYCRSVDDDLSLNELHSSFGSLVAAHLTVNPKYLNLEFDTNPLP